MSRNYVPKLARFLILVILFPLFLVDGSKVLASSERKDVPKLISVRQIAYDTIQITFDQTCDAAKVLKPGNYWMQDTANVNPTGVASLGQDERTTSENALSADQATIIPVDQLGKIYNIKFSDQIPSGVKYRLIICSVTAPNAPEYTGDNGRLVFSTL